MSSFEELTVPSSSSSPSSSLSPEALHYASCYCEENCYKLIERILSAPSSSINEIYCVFISSPSCKTPLFSQRAAQTEDGFVLWDYHVVVLLIGKGSMKDSDDVFCNVVDLDTTIQPFPCPASLYFNCTLRPEMRLKEEYQRLYRVVSGQVYLDSFSSDRSHMKDSDASPPSWPCIIGSKAKTQNVIDSYRYINLQEVPSSEQISLFRGRKENAIIQEREFGIVLQESDFLQWISSISERK